MSATKIRNGGVMRRALVLLTAVAAAASFGGKAKAQEPSAVVVKEIVRTMRNDAGQAVTLPRGRLQLVVSTYDIAPGAKLPHHKHPFQRYAYVLQGDLNVVQVGTSSRIYHAGEFVVESVNRWHFGENVGSVPVKLLVIDQLPRGRASTILRHKGH
jgi:quercetin dioxygenase-like cupin family protein